MSTRGKTIAESRKSLHMSRRTLATLLGVSLRRMWDIENDHERAWPLSSEQADKLGTALGIDRAVLTGTAPELSSEAALRQLCRDVFQAVTSGHGQLPSFLLVRLDQAGWPKLENGQAAAQSPPV